jgi:hypothetical protein
MIEDAYVQSCVVVAFVADEEHEMIGEHLRESASARRARKNVAVKSFSSRKRTLRNHRASDRTGRSNPNPSIGLGRDSGRRGLFDSPGIRLVFTSFGRGGSNAWGARESTIVTTRGRFERDI